MNRTKLIDGLEQDAVSGCRRVLKFRPGQRAYAKRKIRRRERKEGREATWKEILQVQTEDRMNDYNEYRGRCKELSEEAVSQDQTLRLVRGYYHCPIWGKQAHWWTVREDGTINDPSAWQFPSKGCGEYEEFDGMVECEQCGTKVPEDEALYYGDYAFCSELCICRCVGIA